VLPGGSLIKDGVRRHGQNATLGQSLDAEALGLGEVELINECFGQVWTVDELLIFTVDAHLEGN
jgi:hypothetical protein